MTSKTCCINSTPTRVNTDRATMCGAYDPQYPFLSKNCVNCSKSRTLDDNGNIREETIIAYNTLKNQSVNDLARKGVLY